MKKIQKIKKNEIGNFEKNAGNLKFRKNAGNLKVRKNAGNYEVKNVEIFDF